MTDLLKKLHSKSITINLIDDQLDIKAPKGAMTSELLSEIKEHKEALISFISEYKLENANKIVITKATSKSNYVLSSSQYRLWLLQQIESDNNAYNMPSVFSLKGVIDIEDLEKAFLKLIERHEILRTNIFVEEQTGVPKQYIKSVEANNFKLNSIDISKDKDVSKKLQSIIDKEVNNNFDLASDALIRVSLIKRSNDDYVLISVMHHIISDGWSSSVMISDLFSIYQSIVREEETQFEPLTIQYKDFSEWQQSTLDSNSINEDKDYWLNQFKGEVPILDIPTYKLRPSVKTYNGEAIEKRFDKDVTQSFKEICKHQGATLFMGLLSAVKILFYKYTNQTDIVIGSPFAGREHAELQDQIGFYVNTVGLRSSFEKEDTFKTLLTQVKNTTLKAYSHQNYPFDELIKNLDLKIDRSCNPLFDIVLTVDSQEETSDKINLIQNLTIEEIPLDDTTSKFDLEFAFREDKKGSNLFLTYNTDIYTEDFVTKITDHLEVILKNITEHSELTIDSIPYIASKEKTTLLEAFNNTKVDFKCADKTYIDLFEEQVEKTPNNIALVFEEKKLTYKELDELSNQLAHYLIDNYNVSLEDFIGVKLERSDWLIVSFLAILKTGGAYLPIDLEYPKERITFIESDSQCKVIIDSSIISEFEKKKNQLKTLPSVKIKDTNLAYVIYTSGSTGTPKGTLIEHKSLINLCFWHINEYEVNESSKGTLYSGIAFDASIWEICPYLLAGATLYPISDQTIRLDLNNLTSFLKDNNITHSYLPTTITQELVTNNFKSEDIIILTGGDTLKINKEPCFKLFNNYGPTENTVVTTSFNLLDSFDSTIPIGKPISNTSCYILDNNLEPLPIGISGKLYLSGSGVARGYLNKPELTAERFIASPFIEGARMYHTGDIAKWLPDGNIEFLGRNDNQVKIRGHRIELGEVEAHLLHYNDWIVQGVVEVKKVNGENVLVAYYTTSNKESICKSDLRQYLQSKLSEYMIPDYYVELDKIPLTQNDKIDRAGLPNVSEENLVRKEYVAPRNEIDQILVNIWCELLDLEKIGIADNFFELGGNSLKLFSLKYELEGRKLLGIDLKKFYTDPRIISAETYLTKLVKEVKVLSAPLNNENTYLASSIQQTIWVQSQHENLSQLYNIPFGLYINDPEFKTKDISDFFESLMANNEILTTIFINNEGKIAQRILSHETLQLQIEEIDLSNETNPLETKNAIVKQKIKEKFELDKFPLFKITYLKFSASEHYLLIVIHHIITDATSIKMLYELFYEFYQNKDNFSSLIKSNEYQYKDYSYWLENRNNASRELEFWKNKFSKTVEPIELPIDFNRQINNSYTGKSHEFVLEKGEILTVIKQEKITPFTFFTGVFGCFLYEITGQYNFLIGTPFSTRVRSEFKNLLGCFLNTVVINLDIDPEETLQDYLQNLRFDLSACIQNGTYPFTKIVEELGIKRNLGRGLLFDVMIDMIDIDLSSSSNQIERVTMDDSIEVFGSKCDLILYIIDSKEEYKLVLEYNDLLFSTETVEYFQETIEKIIQEFTKDLQTKVEELNLTNLNKFKLL